MDTAQISPHIQYTVESINYNIEQTQDLVSPVIIPLSLAMQTSSCLLQALQHQKLIEKHISFKFSCSEARRSETVSCFVHVDLDSLINKMMSSKRKSNRQNDTSSQIKKYIIENHQSLESV